MQIYDSLTKPDVIESEYCDRISLSLNATVFNSNATNSSADCPIEFHTWIFRIVLPIGSVTNTKTIITAGKEICQNTLGPWNSVGLVASYNKPFTLDVDATEINRTCDAPELKLTLFDLSNKKEIWVVSTL